jgi:hypothetical protein
LIALKLTLRSNRWFAPQVKGFPRKEMPWPKKNNILNDRDNRLHSKVAGASHDAHLHSALWVPEPTILVCEMHRVQEGTKFPSQGAWGMYPRQ